MYICNYSISIFVVCILENELIYLDNTSNYIFFLEFINLRSCYCFISARKKTTSYRKSFQKEILQLRQFLSPRELH